MWPAFDVLLINPANPRSGNADAHPFTSENLALGYLSAVLRRHGADVLILDGDLDGLTDEEIASLVHDRRPVLVGITALARNSEAAVATARAIAARSPGTPIVLGGLHFTYCAEHVLSTVREVTYVIRGEGEAAILELYDLLKRGTGSESAVGGLVYRTPDGIIAAVPPKPAIADLDALPFPDRQVLDRALAQGLRPAVPVLGSRGCYARCLFCNASQFYVEGGGRPWRNRSARNVAEELGELVRRFEGGIDPVFLFYDDTFIGPGAKGRRHARDLADELIERDLGIQFETFLRADTFHDDRDLIARLRKAGMVRSFMGIEAADDRELKLFRKAVTVAQVREALDNLRANRVTTPASGFIMFFPYSSFDSLRRNAAYLKDLGHASLWNLSTRLDVYGGNDFLPLLEREGLIEGSRYFGGYFTYRFRDPRVAAFADFMDIAQHDVVQRLDASSRFVDFDHQNLLHGLEQMGLEIPDGSDGAVTAILRSIQDGAYAFFMDSLGKFEQGAGKDDLIGEREGFLADLDGRIDALELAYGRFLKEIEGVLCHA